MPSIDHKTVWITGASSGIGEALTYTLEKRDCKLIISARREDELNNVKNKCQNKENIYIVPLDITDFKGLRAKAKEALQAFGSIDILVNNAGVSQRSLIQHTDLEVYKKLMDIDYLGTIALSKELLPHFIDRKRGHFVTISSLMGKFGSPYRSGYCAAKHALHGFFDVLRMEHQEDGVDVTLVCPGFVNTDVAKNALTADGTPHTTNDLANQNGMSVHIFAKKVIRAIERKKFEVYIGGKEILGVYLKRFFPKALHRLVLKSRFR